MPKKPLCRSCGSKSDGFSGESRVPATIPLREEAAPFRVRLHVFVTLPEKASPHTWRDNSASAYDGRVFCRSFGVHQRRSGQHNIFEQAAHCDLLHVRITAGKAFGVYQRYKKKQHKRQ